MGKSTQNRNIIRLNQMKLVLEIQNDPNFHTKLLQSLNNKKSQINYLCTTEAMRRIQLFLKQQLKKQIAILETFFSQQPTSTIVSLQQKKQSDQKLIKIIEILKNFYNMDNFYHEDDSILPFYNQIMILTDNFELQAKLISFILNTSFQKLEKEFFYNVYFLCNHLDIYDLQNTSIQEIYEIGKAIKYFKFYFIDKTQQKKIEIQDFYKFLWENKLTNLHYRHVCEHVMKAFNISIEKGSMTHLALQIKIKIYLQAVTFNNDGTVNNNAHSIIQAVAYGNAMYCYIEYFVLGQQLAQNLSIPNIFSFPPAYSDIFKQLLQVFLSQASNKNSHLSIIQAINEILQIQQKTSAVDIVGRLNDNNTLIYKYLTYVKNYLTNQSSLFANSKSKINMDAISSNEFILQLFKVMNTQVQQTHQLNTVACVIVQKIFRKQTICTYNDEVINKAGNLLVSIEYQEEKLMKIIIEKIQKEPQVSKPYLRVLNDLFSKKYHRIIQRRDLAYIARQSSESCILIKLQELIKNQIQTNQLLQRDCFLIETIQLIGNICQESPTLLQSIQKTSSNIIPLLFQLIQQTIKLPADIQSITDTINFMHHVSLIQGPIRTTLLKRPLVCFITKILTTDKFCQCLTRHNKSMSSYIVSTINRFITNIKSAGKYVLNGFINAANKINEDYQKCSLINLKNVDIKVEQFLIRNIQIQEQQISQILKCDAKLINLLKVMQKSTPTILKKFNSRSLYMLIRPLFKITLERDNVFLDCSLQHSLLKLVLNQIITCIKDYNKKMAEIQENNKKKEKIQKRLGILSNAYSHVENQFSDNNNQIRLPTENSQSQAQNPIVNEASQNHQTQVVPEVNVPVIPASDDQQALQLFIVNNMPSDDEQNLSDYENEQDIQHQSKQNKIMEPEKSLNLLCTDEKKLFKQSTWKTTQTFIENYEVMPEQIIQYIYECYESLDKLILPLLPNQNDQNDQITTQLRQKIVKHISQNTLIDQIQNQYISAHKKGLEKAQSYSFNFFSICLNAYSSKLQRLLKFLQLSLNFENPDFNQAQYQSALKNYNNYLIFYLQLVAQGNAKSIVTFMENQQIKYLDTSKLPKSRVQTKTLDIDNLRKNLQNQLNQRWTLYNVLFDSFLRLISGNLNSPNNASFLKRPQGFRHFQFIVSSILQNVQNYLVKKIIPNLYADISVRDFQKFRQSMKVVMQIFVLNDIKGAMQKTKVVSNLLITFYAYSFDSTKQNIFSVLSLIAVQQEKLNKQEDQIYADTKENRWKYIKKVFLKMTFYKIKYFLSQGFPQEAQQIEISQNLVGDPNFENQMKKNYFVFSRIHQMLCIFIENTFLCQFKNGYVRDFLLFNASSFALFCSRILKNPELIYYNYVFEDNPQKSLTAEEFYYQINARNTLLLTAILENLSKSQMIYSPMILKAIFDVQKPTEQNMLAKFNQKMKEIFYETSRKINEIYYTLTGNNLCFGFPVSRKKLSLRISKSSQSSNNEGMSQQIEEEPQFDLKQQVTKLNNLLAFIIEFIKYFKRTQSFEQGNAKISANYVKSIIEFASFLMSNFEVQKHFPQEGDSLVSAIISLIEQFTIYKAQKDEYIKAKKLQRKKQKHISNKKKYKSQRKNAKQSDRQSVSNASYMEQISQNVPSKTQRKTKKSAQKLQKRKAKGHKKSLKRQKPQTSHNKHNHLKQKKNNAKQAPQTFNQELLSKGSILNRVVTDFIKISLTASQVQPYLHARTAQLIIHFLEKFSKDVVLRTQADINNIKNGKLQKISKDKFFIFGAQIFGELLKIKIKNEKIEGFFYLITYLAMKLMTQIHVKIDMQCAIKRFFYQQMTKTQTETTKSLKNKSRIKMSVFQTYLLERTLTDLPDLSYLLHIVELKQNTQGQNSKNKKQSQKQNGKELTEELHEFNKKNFKKFQNYRDQVMYIKLKNSNQLDLINLPSVKRRKPAQNQDEHKKVKFYEYHPEGDFAALICQIISHIVKIIIKQIVQNFDLEQTHSEQQKRSSMAFNLKILLYTLQVLCRQSPSIVPWIARFKCKKILLKEFKIYNLNPENEAYKKIATYVYGDSSILIQNFQEISFLTLLIKFVYPVSQISTFLFELCLDNNVLIQDKSQKSKQQKQQKEVQQNQNKKYVPFGSIIRQKVISELQSQLSMHKLLDQNFIRNGYDPTKGNCLMIKKVSCMGLLTILLSIKQFARLCIQNNLIRRIQQEYLRSSEIVKKLCGTGSQMSLSSSIMRNFMLNYFVRPMQIMQQLTIHYHILKKQSATKLSTMFTNNRVQIRFLLTGDTINDQIFGNDIFFKNKFKSEWFYANNLEGDQPLQLEEGFDTRSDQQSIDQEESQDPYGAMFDDQSQNQHPLDQEIQEEDISGQSIDISGEELLNQIQGQNEDHSGWDESHDPFERDSNTFENVVLYPDEDQVLEGDQMDQDSDDSSSDLEDEDSEGDSIDSYDDSEDQDGLQMQMGQDQDILFPINEDSLSGPQWPFGEQILPHLAINRVVPEVGMYYFFSPQEPQRRQHPNHTCQYNTKPQIKQLENLYEIFMDVVSFEHIIITNNMVRLQNEQAKLIRKIFKVLAYKKVKGQKALHNQNILKLQEEYYNQIYIIFSLDSMLDVCQKIDFNQCERMSYFLQCIPTHYVDLYMDEPEIYFNEIPKPQKGRRRGMFINPQTMQRFRRGGDPSHYRNLLHPLHRFGRPAQRRGLPHPDQSESSESMSNREGQNPQEPQVIHQQGNQQEQNPIMNRIQFNFENPNGGVINFNAELSEILQNMGMSQRQFLNLPHQVQTDIIQNSIQNQLHSEDGNLNQLIGRYIGGQAPHTSPVLMPHAQQIQEEFPQGGQQIQQSQISFDEDGDVDMPQSFQMDEQNDQMNEDNEDEAQNINDHDDTPINQINMQQQGQQVDLPERYRKISLQHSQKISKDMIQILNKDNKNDSKFPQISQELLTQIFQTIFILQNKDFSRFPYSFLNMNMVNSKSCSKILSTIMVLLGLCPAESKITEMIEDKKGGFQQIVAKKNKQDLIPKTSLRTYLYQISNNYENEIYPNISIKLLHILDNLTKSYSISMQMLRVNSNPLKVMQKYILTSTKQECFLSSFQIMIRLLSFQTFRNSSLLVQLVLRITNNIVTHYFEKNIFSIHQQQKQLKKQQPQSEAVQKDSKIQQQKPEEVNILPISLQPKLQSPQPSSQPHKAIQLSQGSIQLLCSLLMSDELRQSQNLSELIMKLSINGKNLLFFIKNIETVLDKLCEKSILFLKKQKSQLDSEMKASSIQVEQTQLDDLMKVFCILEIFSSMIKEFKQFAYRHHIDRYDFIMGKFKDIIESKSLFSLCQTIASIISTTGQGNQLIKSIPEVFQIFFIVFSINIELTTKNGHEEKSISEEKQANKIASLGQINDKHKNSTVKKHQQSIVAPGSYLIQNIAFNKLWNDKVCSPNGRILLNQTIKRKLSTILKRKKQIKNMSLFDIPMIKIVINSPHLLDFQNKRALFRAEIKRARRRSNRTIYMSLDRKQVFQQSFNIIMSKKPQELKNRVKIDFQGEQGQDAGGLTRQWYQLLSTQMFNPNYGLFRPSSTGNTYQPSSTSYVNSQHLNYFKFIGRIMGKALFDGYMLDAYFTPAFYKHILKIPITYLDMEEQDYEYFNSLKWILSNSPIQEYMDLDFTYEFDNFGELKTKQLIPNGQKIKVTQQNKFRYVQLICYAKMATAVQAQLQKFLEGLHQIVPHKYLKIFDAKQLEMMISGLPTVDIVDLKRNTQLVGYNKTQQIIIWLFDVLENFDMSLRTSFLQFVTGTSRVPPQGFKGLMGYNGQQKFTVQKQFDAQKLPRAHTCFNTLDLPPYPTKQVLIEKLTYAITEGKEGFGLA